MGTSKIPHPIASHLWLGVLLAPIAAGIIAPFCFPPYKIWPLVWVALLPFAWAVRARDQAVWVYMGAAIGSVMFFGFGLQFIERMSRFQSLGMAEFLFRLWILASLLGMWVWPLAAFLTRVLFLRGGVPFVVAFGTGWITAEQCRHCFFQLLIGCECPWMHFGYSLANQHELLQLASLGGTTLISAIIAMANAAAAQVFSARVCQRRSATAGLALLVLLSSFAAFQRFRLAGATLLTGPSVAILTSPTGWWNAADFAREDQNYEASVTNYKGSVSLVVWNEYELPALTFAEQSNRPADAESQRTVQQVEDLSTRLGCDVFVGAPRKSDNSKQPARRCVLHISPQVGIVGFSDKQHLLPFGEYAPWWTRLPVLRRLLTGSDPLADDVVQRTNVRCFEIAARDTDAKLRIFPTICFDSAYPSLFRNNVARTDVFLYWASEPQDPELVVAQWLLDIAVLRAVETGRPVVRCARQGYSGVIDPFGRPVVLETDPWTPKPVLIADIPLWNGQTIYSRLGDWPIVVSWVLTVAIVVRRVLVTRGPFEFVVTVKGTTIERAANVTASRQPSRSDSGKP